MCPTNLNGRIMHGAVFLLKYSTQDISVQIRSWYLYIFPTATGNLICPLCMTRSTVRVFLIIKSYRHVHVYFLISVNGF